ncbi:hypothetical protein SAZ11_62395 [Streptomyces sp. FXJ1.4098]|nr:hypothetical protein [Streptomyces sp. FXJ1.4098]
MTEADRVWWEVSMPLTAACGGVLGTALRVLPVLVGRGDGQVVDGDVGGLVEGVDEGVDGGLVEGVGEGVGDALVGDGGLVEFLGGLAADWVGGLVGPVGVDDAGADIEEVVDATVRQGVLRAPEGWQPGTFSSG